MEGHLEKQENTEGHIDTAFEHLIEESRVVGSGKDGIVFCVESNNFSEQDRQALIGLGLLVDEAVDNRVATKILKIYNPELGEHEYKMQERARTILSSVDPKTVCIVPTVSAVKDQHVTARARSILNQEGAELQDRAEVLVMDFVEGKDLGTLMYEFVLEKLGFEKEFIVDMTFSMKEQEVARALGFEQPDLTNGNPADLDALRALTFDRNEAKLIKYLKREGFIIDPLVVQTIERTITTLHAQGFYHNDLHKRNVMLGDNGETYLIDFGRSDTEKRPGCPDDTIFVKQWRQLCLSEEEERREEKSALRAEIESVVRRLTGPLQQAKLDTLAEDIRSKGNSILTIGLARARGSDTALQHFLASLVAVARVHSDIRPTIQDFVNSFDEEGHRWRQIEKNIIARFKNAHMWDE